MCKDELKEYLEQKIAYYKKQKTYYTTIEYSEIHRLCCDVRISCYEEIINKLEDIIENK